MMRGHYAMLSSNNDIYFDPMYTKAYTVSINSQKKKVSEHNKLYANWQRSNTMRASEIEKYIF